MSGRGWYAEKLRKVKQFDAARGKYVALGETMNDFAEGRIAYTWDGKERVHYERYCRMYRAAYEMVGATLPTFEVWKVERRKYS